MSFFALTREELGGDADIVLVTGDAYVDHPSFGIAIIGHILEANGYKVGIIPRPDVKMGMPSRCSEDLGSASL